MNQITCICQMSALILAHVKIYFVIFHKTFCVLVTKCSFGMIGGFYPVERLHSV